MSPEQAAGRVVDHRSDQFALGVILYKLATGVRAFKRDSAAQTLAAIIEDEPEPLEVRNPQVPSQLSRTIARCLSKKPADRYESTRDLAHDLRELVREGSASRGATVGARRSIGMSAAVGAMVVLLGVAAGGWWIARSPRTNGRADETRRVVAVLPFQDLTGDASRSYFAAGVTEEIRGQLTKVSALRLLGRSAVQRYGNDALRQLRSELGAGSAVEGTVRLDGQRARVSVELIDTATERTLWSEQYRPHPRRRALGPDRCGASDCRGAERQARSRGADAGRTSADDERRSLRAVSSGPGAGRRGAAAEPPRDRVAEEGRLPGSDIRRGARAPRLPRILSGVLRRSEIRR